MDYASPATQLLGLLTSVLISLLCLIASVILLRERAAGPWLMLAGSILALIGTAVPQGLYVMESFAANSSGAIYEVSPEIKSLMYFTVWDWLGTSAWFLFSIGLLLVALRRRALARRIAELELLLATRENPGR